MYLSGFSLQNQYRFRDTGDLPIGRRRTVIVGPNNVGKTSLLRSLSPDLSLSPSKTSDDGTSELSLKRSQVIRRYSVFYSEVRAACPEKGSVRFLVDTENRHILSDFLNHTSKKTITLFVKSTGAEASRSDIHGIAELSDLSVAKNKVNVFAFIDPDTRRFEETTHSTGESVKVADFLYSNINGAYHRFSAERLAIGASQAAQLEALRPDCSNLAAYLDHVAPNPEWSNLQDVLRSIIPSVSRVHVRPNPTNGQMREIVLWTSARPRADLAIPLAAAGTGVGQVLALLSIVLTPLDSKTIFIDEPNSFLHPGAAKRLLSTFLDDPKHQYVITTHSLETLRWFDPEVVLLLKPSGDLTDIEVHEWRDLLRSRVFMSELGISYGDVTGADHCIWVEGSTEAEVFPRIARRLLGSRGSTVAFPRVSSTGHFERRARLSKEELLDIYRNVTETVTLIPDTLAFVFDREARSDADRADLKRQMDGKIEFLPRYCFENYLLDTGAIAEGLNKKPTFQKAKLDAAKIEAWWAEHAPETKYWRGDTKPSSTADETWRKDIDAAKLLADMVDDISGGKEKYQKAIDSVAIAKIVLDKNPEAFREIADIIQRFLPKASPG